MATPPAEQQASKEASSGGEGPKKRQYKVRFLSNYHCSDSADAQEFLRVFNQDNFSGEISEIKVTQRQKSSKQQKNKQEAPRPINPCADLYGVRRWQNSLLQQPNSVMLLKIDRIKDEPMIVPLVMKELFHNLRSVMICGASAAIQRQLQAGVDLEFKRIPPMIDADQDLKTSLLDRPKRRTGFQSSMRTIGDLTFLPEPIQEKIKTIQGGKPMPLLTDPEKINLCLLADLCSRYEPVVLDFMKAFQEGEQPVSALSAMFDTMTAEINPAQLIQEFLPYVAEEDQTNVKNKVLLCGYIYKNLQECDKSNRKELRSTRGDFNSHLRRIVIQQRIKSDPSWYRRCHFLSEQMDVEKILFHSIIPTFTKLQEFVEGKEEEWPVQDRVEFFKFLVQMAKKGREPSAADDKKRGNERQSFTRAAAKVVRKEDPSKDSENEKMERMVARKVFSQLRLKNFDVFALWDPRSDMAKLLDKPMELIRHLLQTPVDREELVDITFRLKETIFPYEKILHSVQDTVVKAIYAAENRKLEELEQVYIVHSLPEVIHYHFDLGTQGVHPVERGCARMLMKGRLGLNVSMKPRETADATLFEKGDEGQLGSLKNDPALVARSYASLLGQYVASQVNKFTDHKINHLMRTYKKNFFEMLYEFVVVQNDIPISRDQLVKFLRNQNILANLMDKGWEEGGPINENVDPLLAMDVLNNKDKVELPEEFKTFDKVYREHAKTFIKLLQELKASAAKSPEPENPNTLLWSLYQKGIYNLSSKEAKVLFKKSIYYKNLQNFIAFTASKHFKDFTGEITAKGVQLFIPRKYRELLMIGTNFGFLVGEKLVRYSLLPTPASIKDLDTLSRIFITEFDTEALKDADQRKEVPPLMRMIRAIRRCNRIWMDFSRSLTIGCVDRVLTATSVRNARPGKILPPHLKLSVPDEGKLCLGRAIVSGQATDFSKILKGSEEMGNILTNEKLNATTLDEFAISVHKIERLQEELGGVAGLAQDVLDIVRMLTYSKVEAPYVAKMESMMEMFIRILEKSLRDINESDIQTAHKIARNLKGLRKQLHDIRLGASEKRFISKLRDELYERRSDGHDAKIEFSDTFILQTTDIKVMEKQEDGSVKQQKKEVEMQATHQTLPERIREVAKIHQILDKKRVIVCSPEGQKKKQIDYLLNIVRAVMSLRGNAIQFYIDISTLDPIQQKEISKLIKPSHFYKSVDLIVENQPIK